MRVLDDPELILNPHSLPCFCLYAEPHVNAARLACDSRVTVNENLGSESQLEGICGGAV